jgi:hypothetical protein
MFPTSFHRIHIMLVCWLLLTGGLLVANGADSFSFLLAAFGGGLYVGAMYVVILFNRLVVRSWHNGIRDSTRTRLEAEAEWRREHQRQ